MTFPPQTQTLTRTTFENLDAVNVNRECHAGLVAQHVGRHDRDTDFDAHLVLVNDGTGWAGTYGVVVRALLDDLLPQGPARAMVGYYVDPDPAAGRPNFTFVMARGVLERRDGDDLVFSDGHRIAIDADLVAVLV